VANKTYLRGYDVFVSRPRTPICPSPRCRTVYRDANVLVARS